VLALILIYIYIKQLTTFIPPHVNPNTATALEQCHTSHYNIFYEERSFAALPANAFQLFESRGCGDDNILIVRKYATFTPNRSRRHAIKHLTQIYIILYLYIEAVNTGGVVCVYINPVTSRFVSHLVKGDRTRHGSRAEKHGHGTTKGTAAPTKESFPAVSPR